jgi:hypothetical protein
MSEYPPRFNFTFDAKLGDKSKRANRTVASITQFFTADNVEIKDVSFYALTSTLNLSTFASYNKKYSLQTTLNCFTSNECCDETATTTTISDDTSNECCDETPTTTTISDDTSEEYCDMPDLEEYQDE